MAVMVVGVKREGGEVMAVRYGIDNGIRGFDRLNLSSSFITFIFNNVFQMSG
jgi:hypothetical protein